MSVRLFRGMHVRQAVLTVALFSFFALITFFHRNHLAGEISRLDQERTRLERAVAKLQLDNIEFARRHLSSANDQEIVNYNDDEFVVIYNRVPKTGSTSFAGIAYDLCQKNKFNVLHVNVTKNARTLSLSDQMRFVYNVTTWLDKKPALYHGHVAYIDFAKFGVAKKPIYINIIRDPLDRLVSYYYFVRYGDDFRPNLKRRKAGNKETFDECVEKSGEDCDPEDLWLQIPYFCGHEAACWVPGSAWALQKAKENLVNNYLVVGVTEELGDFIAVLEAVLPRFFKGAHLHYNSGGKSHLRKTSSKRPPSEETVLKIQSSNIWKMENEFYQFATEQFHYIKHQLFDLEEGTFVEKSNRFHYEKIRPR